jgi:hypothetical protein
MDQIREVKYQIIDTNNQIEELTKIVDPVSAVAEREETHTLSKQRYYMYIFWFIIAAIVIYVTIVNMINPNASFSVLVVCIIILVCIFGFIMYTNITCVWYNYIKKGIYGRKNFHFSFCSLFCLLQSRFNCHLVPPPAHHTRLQGV